MAHAGTPAAAGTSPPCLRSNTYSSHSSCSWCSSPICCTAAWAPSSSPPAKGRCRARQFSRGPASRCLAPSVGASQSGWPRPTACHPSPRQDRRVSRPAACVRPAGRTASRPAQGWGGVRGRGGATGWARAVGGKGRLIFLYSWLIERLGHRSPRRLAPRPWRARHDDADVARPDNRGP
jgi:hypothetical protein